MGLEDYVIQMRPTTMTVNFNHVCDYLLNNGFERVAPAAGALPEEYGLLFSRENTVSAIDAEVSEDTDLKGTGLLRCLKFRIAVCQPNSAMIDFLSVLSDSAQTFRLLRLGRHKELFFPDQEHEFQAAFWEGMMRSKAVWRKMFKGDTEEAVIPVAKAWNYYFAKHPELK